MKGLQFGKARLWLPLLVMTYGGKKFYLLIIYMKMDNLVSDGAGNLIYLK